MDELTGQKVKKPKTDKIVAPQDRATLTPAIAEKVDGWIKQIEEKYAGLVSVSRSDLVNYFLDKQPDSLNRELLEKIKTAHFDEVRFAQWALKKIKESKQKGEALSLKDVLSMSRASDGEAPKRTRAPKSAESIDAPVMAGENASKKSNGDRS